MTNHLYSCMLMSMWLVCRHGGDVRHPSALLGSLLLCLSLCADAVMAQPVPTPPASDAPWYKITRSDTCEPDAKGKGPADMLDTWRFLGQNPKMEDVTEHGVVVQTTMTIKDQTAEIKFTWYRGLERCQKALDAITRAEERERQKYR